MSQSEIREGLTFDDVLLVPAASEVLPNDVDLRTRFATDIELNTPLVAAAALSVMAFRSTCCPSSSALARSATECEVVQ